jgi:hypothetical protein
MNYYLFKTEQEAINALNYVNQVGLSMFPPDRVTSDGIIPVNALTGLPEPDATKTVTWDTVKELKKELKQVGWYFTVPTEEVVGFPIPSLQIPGEYRIVNEDDLYTLSTDSQETSSEIDPILFAPNLLTIDAEVVESD